MPSISYFVLASLHPNEIDLGWHIILSKFKEAVVKELGPLCVWVEVIVLPRVDGASVVAQPDVVPCIC